MSFYQNRFCQSTPNAQLIFSILTFADITEDNQFCEPEKEYKEIVYEASLDEISYSEENQPGVGEHKMVLEGRLTFPMTFDTNVKSQRSCRLKFEAHNGQVIEGEAIFLPYSRSRLNLQSRFGEWVRVEVKIDV